MKIERRIITSYNFLRTNTNVTKIRGARTRTTIFDWRATRAWFRTGGYPGPKSDKPQKAIC